MSEQTKLPKYLGAVDCAVCENCGWYGPPTLVLSAANPFDSYDTITGCPACKSVGSMPGGCGVKDCGKVSTAGFQIVGGYMRACSKHYFEITKEGFSQ